MTELAPAREREGFARERHGTSGTPGEDRSILALMPAPTSESASAAATSQNAPPRDPGGGRIDLGALADRRALLMLPVITLGVALPFIARALEPYWAEASTVAQARLFVRFCVSFLLLACFPAVLLLIRIG